MVTVFETARNSGEDGEVVGRETAQTAVSGLGESEPDFVIVFSSAAYDYEAVLSGIRDVTGDADLIGASTAGEFVDGNTGEGGVALAAISSDEMKFFTGVGTELSEDVQGAVESATADFPDELDEYQYEAGINLHDGLTGKGEEITMLAYQQRQVPWVGGSAADDANLEETVVFYNDQVVPDGIVLGLIGSQKPLGQSVEFGHESISEPMTVTSAEGSVVHELDGRPAFNVWEETVRDKASEIYDIDTTELDADHSEFTNMLTRFEFGIETGGNQKIRWPGLTPDAEGSLHFATAIPEEAEVTITHSSKEAQIDAARGSAQRARETTEQDEVAGALIFDCFCQGAILGDEFDESVGAMVEELSAPLAGFQTYGEISLQEDDMRGYHNTTSSVLLLPK